MYFGSKEEFTYLECSACHSLHVASVPEDLARHYPPAYYSFSASKQRRISRWQISLRRRRTEEWLHGGGGLVGKCLAFLSKRKPEYLDWLSGLGLTTSSRILDVGCGNGALLLKMRRDGFTCLRGIDPFLPEPVNYDDVVIIANRQLEEIEETFDLIMFHHSLEHMPHPRMALSAARERLRPGGAILVRLPIAGGYAWRKYREHWYALDAPRHLAIPSQRGMHLLAASCGLAVRRCFYDSDPGQFLASENYLADIPLMFAAQQPQITKERMDAIRAFVAVLNHIGDGDCGGFVLMPQ